MSLSHSLILFLAGIGILNTSYLSYHAITKKPVLCLFFPEEWCRKVQFSPWSRTFGIPNPFSGLAIYIAIFLLTLMSAQGYELQMWIKGIIVIGFLFSLYFTAIQAFVLRAFCTWCVLSALDFLFLFVIAIFYLV